MSKGSKQRPSFVDDETMLTNWHTIFGVKKEEKSNLIEIYIWPDGTWCGADDLEEMTYMSDDYTLVHLTEREWLCLVGDTQGLL